MLSLALHAISLRSCFCFQSCTFRIVVASLVEERERVYVLLLHLFVYFARVQFCLFYPLDARIRLQFVILALPGLFC